MTGTQLGRPVGASGAQTRQRVIAATMRCVAEKGYSRATIREIARTANVTSASLYNYFPTKTELIKAAVAARTEIALPRLRRAAEQPGDAVDRIEAVLDESGRLMREYPDLAAFEWAIRAQGTADQSAGGPGDVGLHALREIIEGVIYDAHGTGRLGRSRAGTSHRRGDLCALVRPDRTGRNGRAQGIPAGAFGSEAVDQGRIVLGGGAAPARRAVAGAHPGVEPSRISGEQKDGPVDMINRLIISSRCMPRRVHPLGDSARPSEPAEGIVDGDDSGWSAI